MVLKYVVYPCPKEKYSDLLQQKNPLQEKKEYLVILPSTIFLGCFN